MSKKKKKEYTVNDLLEEFFPETGSDKISEEISDFVNAEIEKEEITAEDLFSDDTEVVTDMLEDDPSERTNADITLADESEWEIPEISESDMTGTYDGNNDADKEATPEESCENDEHGETESSDAEEEDKDEDEDEDVNQRFMERFLKGIFPWKGDSVWEIIRKIVFIAAVVVFIGAGIMLISTLIQSKEAIDDKADVQSVITTTAATTIDENGNVVTIPPSKEDIAEHNFNVAEYFKNINDDYVGYLELDGCDIYEPVMRGDDNEYYLTHNYFGNYNKAGSVFMDHRCTFTDESASPNIVIYGHNQEDGTMFGNLKRYKQNVEFYKAHPVVKLSSENKTDEYLIYGFFVTNALEKQDSNGVVFHYHDYIETLNDEKTFNWYMDMIKERNQIISPVDVVFGDKLLCLSTCSNEFSNSRFVIFARQLRDGETSDDYDFSKTYLNPNARGVDWDAIMSGETSSEETDESEESIEETEDFEIKVFVDDFTETTVTEKPKTGKRKKKVTEKITETTETTETSAVSDESSAITESVTVYTGTTGLPEIPVYNPAESYNGVPMTEDVPTVTTVPPQEDTTDSN